MSTGWRRRSWQVASTALAMGVALSSLPHPARAAAYLHINTYAGHQTQSSVWDGIMGYVRLSGVANPVTFDTQAQFDWLSLSNTWSYTKNGSTVNVANWVQAGEYQGVWHWTNSTTGFALYAENSDTCGYWNGVNLGTYTPGQNPDTAVYVEYDGPAGVTVCGDGIGHTQYRYNVYVNWENWYYKSRPVMVGYMQSPTGTASAQTELHNQGSKGTASDGTPYVTLDLRAQKGWSFFGCHADLTCGAAGDGWSIRVRQNGSWRLWDYSIPTGLASPNYAYVQEDGYKPYVVQGTRTPNYGTVYGPFGFVTVP